MKFTDRIKDAARVLTGKSFGMSSSQYFFSLAGKGSLRQKSVEKDPAGGYAGWVYAAISKRAKRVGAIELHLFELMRNGDLKEHDDHEVLALLYKANPMQTQYQFFYTIEMMLGIWGSAPVYKDRAGSKRIQYLWPMRPDLLTANTDRMGKVLTYSYRVPGNVMKIRPEDIININEPSPVSLLAGHSPTMSAGLEIDSDIAAAVWNKHLLENFAEPGGVLTTDKSLSDKEFERLKEQWEKRQAGPTNAGRWAILEKGLKAEVMAKGPKDMELLESRKFHRNAITAILGVPMALMTSEDVNLANAEAAERVFATDTVDPQMKLITGCLNEFMVTEFGESLYIDYDSPIPEDTQKKINVALAGEGRWMTVNEARDIFDLPELEGGDAIFKPLGVMPQVGEGTEAARTFGENSIKGYERIEVGKGDRPTRKHARIIRSIKSRTAVRRKMQNGIVERVINELAKHSDHVCGKDCEHEEKKVTIRFKGAKVRIKSDDSEESKLDPRLIAERKSFLRELPKAQLKYRRRFSKYFSDQKSEVLKNVNDAGIPKGRGGAIAAKSSADKWINRILFNSTEADEAVEEIGSDMYRDNITTGSAAVASLLGVDPSDILATPFVLKFVEKKSFELLKVNETTREDLRKTLRDGLALGEDIGQIRDRIEETYKKAETFRAETIARTEVGSAQNFGRLAEMEQQKVENKIWIAAFSNTRDDHADADGQVVGRDDSFNVGGESLEYPGDPSGSAANVINCQCSVSPTLKDVTA